MYLGLGAHWRGDTEEAERELAMATELEPEAAFAGQSAAILAIHQALRGRDEDVLALWEARKERLPVAGRVNSLGSWNMMFGFTEALYLIGRREEAAALYPLILEALELDTDWVTFDCRPIRTRAAIAAAAGGRWAEAEEHYRAALEAAEKLPNLIEQADLRRLRAQMLLERDEPGDRELARDLLKEAAAAYGDMGMPWHVELARSISPR